jgi:hypothetical protein
MPKLHVLLLTLCCFFAASCATSREAVTPPSTVVQTPIKVPASLFQCTPDPAVWNVGATNTVITLYIRRLADAKIDCQNDLARACEVLAVNDMIVGECPPPRQLPTEPLVLKSSENAPDQ